MIVVGILAVVGGHHDKQVVHDEPPAEKIFFTEPATNPGLASDARQQVLTGKQAKLHAQKPFDVDLTTVAVSKNYSHSALDGASAG